MWWWLCLNFFGKDVEEVGVEGVLMLGMMKVFWRYVFCLFWLFLVSCFGVWMSLGGVMSVGGGGGNLGILCMENICFLNKFKFVV